jgi:hypothetical protein
VYFIYGSHFTIFVQAGREPPSHPPCHSERSPAPHSAGRSEESAFSFLLSVFSECCSPSPALDTRHTVLSTRFPAPYFPVPVGAVREPPSHPPNRRHSPPSNAGLLAGRFARLRSGGLQAGTVPSFVPLRHKSRPLRPSFTLSQSKGASAVNLHRSPACPEWNRRVAGHPALGTVLARGRLPLGAPSSPEARVGSLRFVSEKRSGAPPRTQALGLDPDPPWRVEGSEVEGSERSADP